MNARAPLLDLLVAEMEARGFRRLQQPNGATLWTCDEWKDYWQRADLSTYDRKSVLLDAVASVIGEESGYEKITSQPQYTIYVKKGDETTVWSVRDTLKGGKIALANARRAAAKRGFTDVWMEPAA